MAAAVSAKEHFLAPNPDIVIKQELKECTLQGIKLTINGKVIYFPGFVNEESKDENSSLGQKDYIIIVLHPLKAKILVGDTIIVLKPEIVNNIKVIAKKAFNAELPELYGGLSDAIYKLLNEKSLTVEIGCTIINVIIEVYKRSITEVALKEFNSLELKQQRQQAFNFFNIPLTFP